MQGLGTATLRFTAILLAMEKILEPKQLIFKLLRDANANRLARHSRSLTTIGDFEGSSQPVAWLGLVRTLASWVSPHASECTPPQLLQLSAPSLGKE